MIRQPGYHILFGLLPFRIPSIPSILVGPLLLIAAVSAAHPELLQIIDDVTSQIESAPKNGALYLRRGELYRLHQDWTLATADYTAAARHHADPAGVLLARAHLALDTGDITGASLLTSKLVSTWPQVSQGHLLRSRALAASGRFLAAADAITSAIDLQESPLPESYAERAHLLQQAGETTQAIHSLDQAALKLGRRLVSLETQAVELEMHSGQWAAARRRVERLAANVPRKERYLVQLAELYSIEGDTSSSRRKSEEALNAISQLSVAHQRTSATLQLLDRIRRLQHDLVTK